MPVGVRHSMHSGVSSIQLLGDMNTEILARPGRVDVDATCGCPTWATTQTLDQAYPPRLQPLYSQLQWDSLLGDVNASLEATNVPPCPLSACFVIPPLFCLWYYCRGARSKEREELLMDRIAEENARLALVGLEWTEPTFIHRSVCGIARVPELRGSIQLQMSIDARTRFELENPGAPQYLAALLLDRSERRQPLTPASRQQSLSRSRSRHEVRCEEDQHKLISRQATLARRNSLPSASTLTTAPSITPDGPSQADLTMTPADANARWAEPTNKPTFVPIMPNSPTDAPTQEQMTP